MPLNGRVAALPGTIASAGDTLFTSGTLGRYSKVLSFGDGSAPARSSDNKEQHELTHALYRSAVSSSC